MAKINMQSILKKVQPIAAKKKHDELHQKAAELLTEEERAKVKIELVGDRLLVSGDRDALLKIGLEVPDEEKKKTA